MLPACRIIFQSNRWVACDKKAGWLSVPSRMGHLDPRPVLGTTLASELASKVWPIHRLDLEVSGIILFALDAAAHRQVCSWFENHMVQKTYEAWTPTSTPPAPQEEQEWRCHLVRGKKRSFEAAYGKPSITLACAIGLIPFGDESLQQWHLKPQTGRAHQLRYELSRHGHPIVGDRLYGSRLTFLDEGIALRAVKLDFSRCDGYGKLGLPACLEVASIADTLTR